MLVMALIATPFAGDDPWKASALISALSQLLLAILFLLQTIVACLTLQVIKSFGLTSSCWYATYRPYINDPSLAEDSSRDFKEKGAFRCGQSSRSSASSSSQPSFHFHLHKLIRGLEASIARTVSIERGFLVRRRPKIQEDESGSNGLENRESVSSRSRNQEWSRSTSTTLVCPKCNAAWTVTRPPVSIDAKDVHAKTGSEERSDGNEETFHRQGRATSPFGNDEQRSVGREGISSKSQEESKEPAGFQGLHEVESKDLQPLCHGTESDLAGVEASKLFSDVPEGVRLKLASSFKKVAEQSGVIGISGSGDYNVRPILTEVELETERNYGSSSDVIAGLKNALQVERKAFCALYEEFEEERNAAESAANEAIGMISRLQEEKAALQMESAHYKRMAEEKAFYDEQAMQLLQEVLYKRERENSILEKEIQLFKERFFREVIRATKRRKEVENSSLSLVGQEPLLLLECSKDTLISDEHQEVSVSNLEIQVAEQIYSDPHGAASGENSFTKSSFRTEMLDEQPHKRFKGFSEDEPKGYGLACPSDNLSDMTSSTLADAHEFEQVCQGSLMHREQAEQVELTSEISGSALDEDDTNLVLHCLRAVEDQLCALGEADSFEFHNLAHFLENHSITDNNKSDSFASVDKDIVDSACFDAARISPWQECKAVKCSKEGLIQMSDGLCNSSEVVDCLDACCFDEGISSNVDVTTSFHQSGEGAQICAMNDISVTPLREDTGLCSLHCEANVTIHDDANPARNFHCVSYFSHDEIAMENSGFSIKDVNQHSSSTKSNAGTRCSSNVDLWHDIVSESQQCQSHGKDYISGDEKWNYTKKDGQGLNITVQVFQSEGVLEGHPSTSLNPKDVGVGLLKELSQQLQDHRLVNGDTGFVQASLPVPTDSYSLSTSRMDTIIRKRQFLNGPGQT